MPPLNELYYLYVWCMDQEREALKIADPVKSTDVLGSYLNIKDEIIWLGYWLYNVYVPDLGGQYDSYKT